jgi:3-phenylpropionate/trans-cinnamate dioxygenase ferredoxin reductase subunit
MSQRVVIVGAGQAGLQVAISLRQGGFEGKVVLLGKEPHLPYQRPPLSKQVLKGEWPPEKCRLRQQAFLDEQAIDFRPGSEVASVDCERKQLSLSDQRVIDYDSLVICTGARLNRLQLSGSGLSGIHYLRTIDDALALKARCNAGARLVVAGGGYIGLEVAASARAMGCEVDVIEPQDHIMKRSALPAVADFLLARHRAEGVRVHLGRLMTEIHGGDRVRAVSMDNGNLVDADLLLKGIGVRPELRWLENSGIDTELGVLVDTRCRTNIADVYAAGDVAQGQHPLLEQATVLESVQNAVSQGKVVAANILGLPSQYTEVPWFWSEQYDCRFQMAGLARAGDELVIRTSGPNSVSVLSLGTDRLHAIQCVNAPRDYMAGRKLIAAGSELRVDQLRDPGADLKALL